MPANVPGEQGRQKCKPFSDNDVLENVPAGQAEQEDEPFEDENVPSVHGKQELDPLLE